MMSEHQEPIIEAINRTSPSRKRSKVVSGIVWGFVLIGAPLCCAWVIGRDVYWFDILASQQLLISWAALVLTVVILLLRRWWAALICIVLMCVSFYPVLIYRKPTLPKALITRKEPETIRIVTLNINPKNPHWEKTLLEVFQFDSDIVVVNEVGPHLNRAVRKYGLVDNTEYKHWSHRAFVDEVSSPCFIFSRLELTPIDTVVDPQYSELQLLRKVSHPLGDFVIGLAHPLSPRTWVRWVQGNEMIESQARAAVRVHTQNDLPILIAADLNAGPGQTRAATFRNAGLRMSKPVFYYGGSFPSNSNIPAALRIQLDDVWFLGEIKPVAWNMIELAGTDHSAIIVDFQITQQ